MWRDRDIKEHVALQTFSVQTVHYETFSVESASRNVTHVTFVFPVGVGGGGVPRCLVLQAGAGVEARETQRERGVNSPRGEKRRGWIVPA